jgi:tetratricopeptide (TPR) repeat protein
VETLPAAAAGAVGATLLASSGDLTGALAALERGASGERFAPLAALLLLRAAEIQPHAGALKLLDQAVAAAPTLQRPRRARFEARLARGDVSGALSEAEHLEAMASGAGARHAACALAGARLLDSGYEKQAGRAFERALRYMPDDARATSGLGRSLLACGQTTRAVALFERAIALSERRGQPDDSALLSLARILGEQLADLPQAIARARQVAAEAPEAEQARHLEGVYRGRIGDRVGASLAFGRMRELIELSGAKTSVQVARLCEAARFELGERAEPALAERHLALALRLAPQDPEVAAQYRRAAELLDTRQRH